MVRGHRKEAKALRAFAQPTGYGLGAKAWVSLYFAADEAVPLRELRHWIEESYRAVAPNKLVRELDGATQSLSR